jgi:DHA1 family multidrug resistance protein-like MFS transporter
MNGSWDLLLTFFKSAASAIAANTFLRSLAGAGFPLFSQYMFAGLGVNWAGTLLGCVAAVLVPIPVAFYIYGHKIRQRSAYAPSALMKQDTVSESEPVVTEKSTVTGSDAV